jgi:GntR family transcriptional regulator
VRQLAADLRVNFNTIARAYRMLDEEGIISTQHGRGTFILDRPADTSAEALRREDLIRLTRTYLTQAHHLDYKPEEVQALFEEELGEWQDNGAPPATEGE